MIPLQPAQIKTSPPVVPDLQPAGTPAPEAPTVAEFTALLLALAGVAAQASGDGVGEAADAVLPASPASPDQSQESGGDEKALLNWLGLGLAGTGWFLRDPAPAASRAEGAESPDGELPGENLPTPRIQCSVLPDVREMAGAQLVGMSYPGDGSVPVVSESGPAVMPGLPPAEGPPTGSRPSIPGRPPEPGTATTGEVAVGTAIRSQESAAVAAGIESLSGKAARQGGEHRMVEAREVQPPASEPELPAEDRGMDTTPQGFNETPRFHVHERGRSSGWPGETSGVWAPESASRSVPERRLADEEAIPGLLSEARRWPGNAADLALPMRTDSRGEDGDPGRRPELTRRAVRQGPGLPEEISVPVETARERPREVIEVPRLPLSPGGIERVVSAARMSASQGGVEVRLRLHPESLGDVQVRVRWEGGVLTARLEAATSAARDALEAGLQTLRTALQEQGVPVDRLQVALRLDLGTRSHGHELWRQGSGTPAPAPEAAEPVPTGSEGAPVPTGRLDVRI